MTDGCGKGFPFTDRDRFLLNGLSERVRLKDMAPWQ
jgi:hypothetical protein